MNRAATRTPLGRALGLGSARDGVEDWWRERVSAVALLPLTGWFAVSIVAHAADGYSAVTSWLRSPVTTTLLVLLLIALFYHTALGFQVVIEDYVHSRAKLAALIGVRLGCIALAVAGIVAALTTAFGA